MVKEFQQEWEPVLHPEFRENKGTIPIERRGAETGARAGFARSNRPVRLGEFNYPEYPFVKPGAVGAETPEELPVVVVGGGLVGLTLALDLAKKGVRTTLLDDNNTVSAGSRSIAQARRTMEIWSRLGCAERMAAKGVSWSRGHTHYLDKTILSFQVFPEGHSRFPSFTSLAQYYVESILVDKAADFPHLELRWQNRVVGVTRTQDTVLLDVETPAGHYRIRSPWVVAADGAKSGVRAALGLDFPGTRLKDKFVIADVRLKGGYPNERNFWFRPPFYDGNTVLRVPQSDNIWRIDWQVDADADPAIVLAEDEVQARLKAILGEGAEFVVEWVSTYTSEHRLMERWRHGRVFFVGDAAHQFSPFGGGRGGNSGVQDADNLGWKLAAVIRGEAGEALLDSYEAERRPIAYRNLSDSMTSTEFITPKSAHSQGLRDAVLGLATLVPFAKTYVNTGRFAVWPVLEASPLSLADDGSFTPELRPGTPARDCPVLADGREGWLIDSLGDEFVLLLYDAAPSQDLAGALQRTGVRLVTIAAGQGAGADLADSDGRFAALYDARPGTAYLFRPDQHVLARWRQVNASAVERIVSAVLGRIPEVV